MKKNILIILSLFIFIGLLACSNQKKSNNIKDSNNVTVKELDVREIVWNQLTSKDKKQIKGTWKDSELRKITLNENMGIINDESYIGKEVYIIDLPTKSLSEPCNMIVYASLDDYKIIGYGFLD